MKTTILNRLSDSTLANADLYLPGQPAKAGVYRDIETGREVEIFEDGVLPAALDGHVACYVRFRTRTRLAQVEPKVKKKCSGQCASCRQRMEEETTALNHAQ